MPKRWTKNEQPDANGSQCGNEDHSRGQVFGGFGFGVQVGRGEIDGRFDRSVEPFEDQHQCDREQENGPLGAGDLKPRGQGASNQPNASLDSGVALGFEEITQADEGEVEGADQAVAASGDWGRIVFF